MDAGLDRQLGILEAEGKGRGRLKREVEMGAKNFDVRWNDIISWRWTLPMTMDLPVRK